MKAAIYVRVSTEEQARQGASPEAQRRLCREWAEGEGYELCEARVYKEARSGAKADRPEYQRMLADAASGEFEALAVWKFDRLGRDAEELLRARRMLEAAGVRLVSVTEGEEDSNLVYGVRALVAQEEREKISERTKIGLEEVARSGRYSGGRRPYGYTIEGARKERRLLIDAGEASTIGFMADLYEAGAGFREIAARLNERGISSPTGITWDRSSVANVLGSPIIKGCVHLKGEEYPGLHEAIIDPERWERLREIREGRKGKGRRPVGLHAFTGGILRCPECQSALRPRTTPKGYAYYECTGRSAKDRGIVCGQSAINARLLEGKILDGLLGLVFDPEQTRERIETSAAEERARAKGMIDAAEKRIRAVKRKRDRAMADYLDERLDAAQWKKAEVKLDEEEAQAQAHAAELEEAADAAQSEAANIDAEKEVVARLEALQEIIGGDRDAGVEVLRQAITGTFERVYLLEDPDGKLVVAPVLRREAVKALGGTARIETAKHGSHESRTQLPARIPLPASLTKATSGS